MRSWHLRWNFSSPTDSASSTSRMSGSTSVATAKARRAAIPVEKVRIGRVDEVLAAPPTRRCARAAARVSRAREAQQRALEHDVLAARQLAVEPEAELQDRGDPSRDDDAALRRAAARGR